MSEGELTKTYSDESVCSDVDVDDVSGDEDLICARYVRDENDSSCSGHDVEEEEGEEEDLMCASRHISKEYSLCALDRGDCVVEESY